MRADVVVIGCGPTGGVLANLLGLQGLDVVVLERDAEVYPVPRATHLDEETLRNLQATGLLEAILPHAAPFGTFSVVDVDGHVLLTDAMSARDADGGHVGSRFFDQPALERVLREGLRRFPRVRLLAGVAAEGIEDRGDVVHVRAVGADGAPVEVDATWAVGCDGGRSLAREVVGTGMEALAPERRWTIVDARIDPDRPPALPDGFRYVLDPARLTLYAHGFGCNRRWEFRLRDDEPEPAPDEVRRWLRRHVDLDRLEVVRATTYTQRALVAWRWRAGRVLLAGDAAHLMPPFAGQGMCSGIRDAVDLAWKLGWVIRGRASDALLDTYETERRAHVREVTLGALFLGDRLDARTPLDRWVRAGLIRLLGAWSGLREALRRRAERRPPLVDGLVAGRGPCRGELLPPVRTAGHDDPWLDDVVGYRGALVAPSDTLDPEDVAWAEANDFAVVDAGGHHDVRTWLAANGAGCALVRPDRHVFGAGPVGSLGALRAAFDRGTRGALTRAGATPPRAAPRPPGP